MGLNKHGLTEFVQLNASRLVDANRARHSELGLKINVE